MWCYKQRLLLILSVVENIIYDQIYSHTPAKHLYLPKCRCVLKEKWNQVWTHHSPFRKDIRHIIFTELSLWDNTQCKTKSFFCQVYGYLCWCSWVRYMAKRVCVRMTHSNVTRSSSMQNTQNQKQTYLNTYMCSHTSMTKPNFTVCAFYESNWKVSLKLSQLRKKSR